MAKSPCNVCATPSHGGYCARHKRDRNLARGYLNTLYGLSAGVCHHCGELVNRPDATLDHLTPRAQGGTDHPSNLALAHRACNSAKGAL